MSLPEVVFCALHASQVPCDRFTGEVECRTGEAVVFVCGTRRCLQGNTGSTHVIYIHLYFIPLNIAYCSVHEGYVAIFV